MGLDDLENLTFCGTVVIHLQYNSFADIRMEEKISFFLHAIQLHYLFH